MLITNLRSYDLQGNLEAAMASEETKIMVGGILHMFGGLLRPLNPPEFKLKSVIAHVDLSL